MMVSLTRRTFTSGTAYSGFGVVAGFVRACVGGFLFLFCTNCCYSSHRDSAIVGRFDCSLAPTLGTVCEAGRADGGIPVLLHLRNLCQSTCSIVSME